MQKKIYLFLLFIVQVFTTSAQKTGVLEAYSNLDEYPRFIDCAEVTASIEEKEECAEVRLLQFVYSNMKYPETAKTAKVEGPIAVQFTVTESGKVLDPKIIKSLGSGCDEELLRIIGLMSDWIPGKTGNAPQKTEFVLSMKFKL